MKIYKETLKLMSSGSQPTYHEITNKVREIVKKSGVQNGTVLIQSQHTTCSIIFEEYVHDVDFNGYEFLQIDLNRILDRLIPPETTEDMEYRYPGPKHVEFAKSFEGTDEHCELSGILNADSHLRGSLFGPSETFVVEDGKVLTGSFGYIYFVDWDRRRVRERKCHVLVMGE